MVAQPKINSAAVFAHLAGATTRLDSCEPLRSVHDFVDRNIDRRISLQEAAEVAGYERTYFSTYFRARVGITYTQWLTAIRVSRAVTLLTGTHLSVAEVCEEAGFGDLRTMERNFNRYVGMTPSGVRRGIRPEPQNVERPPLTLVRRQAG